MKTSINQIQATIDSIISRQYQTEEWMWEMEDKIKKLLHANNHKEKRSIHMSTTCKNSWTDPRTKLENSQG
jgi:hypothetical protein